MNELLKKIFDNVISYEDDTVEVDRQIDEKIHIIIDQYREKLTDIELEELSGHLYYIALLAEQEGFQLGIKYLLKIAISLLLDS